MTVVPAQLQRTPLFHRHVALGARMIGFGGWEMPVRYEGITSEHHAVRQRAGIFDLSHMGELWLSGPGAGAALAYALVSDPPRLKVGRAHYSMICTPQGGIIDDLIVYRVADERFLVVPNAANVSAVAEALRHRLAGFEAALDDASLRTSLIAVQGPEARSILAPLTDLPLESLPYYAIAEGHAAGVPAYVARTGYTGEDGFELFVHADAALDAWDRIWRAGREGGLAVAGLGARDTLRLEAGMPLYGNELDLATTPLEAGQGRIVKLDKESDFVGRAALASALEEGPTRSLIGLSLHGRGIARHGHPVHGPDGADPIGLVTSGTLSPTLGTAIAMAYVPRASSATGTMLGVRIRTSHVPAEVVELPFYQRPP